MKNNIYTTLAVAVLMVAGIGTYFHVQNARLFAQTGHLVCASINEKPIITARTAHVYDVKTGETLFEKNAEAQVPLASITKIATAVVVAESLDPEETITITEDALLPEGDSGLFAGEVWRVKDLIDFTLMTSSNDGARALALSAGEGSLETFIEKMNALTKRIGADQTFFLNETGLDVSMTTAGSYGSARDIAHLLSYAYVNTNDAFTASTQSASVYTSLSGFEHLAIHTTEVAGSIPGQVIVKTGFTDLAGGNLAVLAEVIPGRPVAVVVLGATRETRQTDAMTLLNTATEIVKHGTLCDKI